MAEARRRRAEIGAALPPAQQAFMTMWLNCTGDTFVTFIDSHPPPANQPGASRQEETDAKDYPKHLSYREHPEIRYFGENAYARCPLSIQWAQTEERRPRVGTKTSRPGQRGKSIEEVVAYAVGHRIRVHILIVLNEGTYTAAQIAEIIGEPLNNVSNHIRELLDAGSIELAKTVPKRNVLQHYYRAVEMPYFSDEEIAAMTPEQRQVTAGLVIQSMLAEVMASLWGGKMHSDPRVWLAWNWFNVDQQGREEIADEQERSWERIQQIEVEATNRRAETGEEATSIVVTQLGFERARKAREFPSS